MIPLSSTESKPVELVPVLGEASQKTKAVGSKIGWLHTLADEKGASFDLVIKDGLGRVKATRRNCKSESNQFGELINIPTFLGEDLEVSVENVVGAKNIKVFLN